MKRIITAIAALSLGACVTMPDSPTRGVHALGDNLFSVSQNAVPFGSTAAHAARFCDMSGRQMRPRGSSTEQTLWTDRQYAVLIFSCEDR